MMGLPEADRLERSLAKLRTELLGQHAARITRVSSTAQEQQPASTPFNATPPPRLLGHMLTLLRATWTSFRRI